MFAHAKTLACILGLSLITTHGMKREFHPWGYPRSGDANSWTPEKGTEGSSEASSTSPNTNPRFQRMVNRINNIGAKDVAAFGVGGVALGTAVIFDRIRDAMTDTEMTDVEAMKEAMDVSAKWIAAAFIFMIVGFAVIGKFMFKNQVGIAQYAGVFLMVCAGASAASSLCFINEESVNVLASCQGSFIVAAGFILLAVFLRLYHINKFQLGDLKSGIHIACAVSLISSFAYAADRMREALGDDGQYVKECHVWGIFGLGLIGTLWIIFMFNKDKKLFKGIKPTAEFVYLALPAIAGAICMTVGVSQITNGLEAEPLTLAGVICLFAVGALLIIFHKKLSGCFRR